MRRHLDIIDDMMAFYSVDSPTIWLETCVDVRLIAGRPDFHHSTCSAAWLGSQVVLKALVGGSVPLPSTVDNPPLPKLEMEHLRQSEDERSSC